MRPNILCLETSAALCSVSLTSGDNKIVFRQAEARFSHVSNITLLIKGCLEDADIRFEELDAVAISGGPGSYTGLRVGASTAKGICFANDVPLIALDTLRIIGYTMTKEETDHSNPLYIGIIDARRDEVYMAGFDKNLTQVLDDQAYILESHSFKSESNTYDKIIIGGDAIAKTKEILSSTAIIYKDIRPDASHMVDLAIKAFREQNFVDSSSYTPHYLKPPNITVSKKQLFRKN